MNSTRLIVAGTALMAAIAGLFLARNAPPGDAPHRLEGPPEYLDRRTNLQMFWGASPEDVDRSIASSDAIRAALEEEGVRDVAEELWNRIRQQEVSTAECRAFYEQHPDLYRHRDFDEAEASIRRILGIRKVRQQFEPGGIGQGEEEK